MSSTDELLATIDKERAAIIEEARRTGGDDAVQVLEDETAYAKVAAKVAAEYRQTNTLSDDTRAEEEKARDRLAYNRHAQKNNTALARPDQDVAVDIEDPAWEEEKKLQIAEKDNNVDKILSPAAKRLRQLDLEREKAIAVQRAKKPSPQTAGAASAAQPQPAPASPPTETPWEAVARQMPQLRALAEGAVSTVIDPQNESERFAGTSFKGVELRQPFDVRDQMENRFLDFLWPVEANKARDSSGAKVSVFVDKQSSSIVGICSAYDRSLSDMVDDVVEVFGKSAEEIREFTFWADGPPPVRVKRVSANYVFPKTIVQVVATSDQNFPAGTTRIFVFDRPYVESALRKYAYAAAASVAWLKATLESVQTDGAGMDDVETIAATVLERTQQYPAVICSDPGSRKRVEATLREGRFNHLSPWSYDVACLYVSQGGLRGVCDPVVCEDTGLLPLVSREGVGNGLEVTIADTVLEDLFWRVGSIVAQRMFPPATEELSVITPFPDSPEGAAKLMGVRRNFGAPWVSLETSPETRVEVLARRLNGDRYEWNDANGWRICVGRNLAFSVDKPAKPVKKGL